MISLGKFGNPLEGIDEDQLNKEYNGDVLDDQVLA
jgi:hypothetical protein